MCYTQSRNLSKFLLLVSCLAFIQNKCAIRSINRLKLSPNVLQKSAPGRIGQSQKTVRPIHIEKTKGFYSALRPEGRQTSPIHGAGFINGSFIKNLYRFSGTNDATTQLVHEMFHMLDNNIRPTANKSKAAYGLTPGVIGSIIGALEIGALTKEKIKKEIIEQLRAAYRAKTGDKMSIAKVNNFIDLIIASAQEGNATNPNAKYVSRIPQMLLLGFLYRISSTKEELIEYLKSVEKFFPVLQETINYQKLIDGKYDEHDYIPDVLNQNAEFSEEFLNENYEKLIYTIITEAEFIASYPPPVSQGYYGFNDQKAAPDCMERTVREICNLLLADMENKKFDLKLLKPGIKVHQKIKNFYTQFNTFAQINESKTGQAWMDLVSDIPGIIYLRGNYELKATKNNIIPLFNYLFNLTATSLENLGDQLSNEKQAVSIRELKSSEEKVLIKLEIKKIIGKTTSELDIILVPGHAATKQGDAQNEIGLKKSVALEKVAKTAVKKIEDSIGNNSLVSLIQPKVNYEMLTKSNAEEIQALLLQKLDSPEELAESLYALLLKKNMNESDELEKIIMNIFNAAPGAVRIEVAFSLMNNLAITGRITNENISYFIKIVKIIKSLSKKMIEENEYALSRLIFLSNAFVSDSENFFYYFDDFLKENKKIVHLVLKLILEELKQSLKKALELITQFLKYLPDIEKNEMNAFFEYFTKHDLSAIENEQDDIITLLEKFIKMGGAFTTRDLTMCFKNEKIFKFVLDKGIKNKWFNASDVERILKKQLLEIEPDFITFSSAGFANILTLLEALPTIPNWVCNAFVNTFQKSRKVENLTERIISNKKIIKLILEKIGSKELSDLNRMPFYNLIEEPALFELVLDELAKDIKGRERIDWLLHEVISDLPQPAEISPQILKNKKYIDHINRLVNLIVPILLAHGATPSEIDKHKVNELIQSADPYPMKKSELEKISADFERAISSARSKLTFRNRLKEYFINFKAWANENLKFWKKTNNRN